MSIFKHIQSVINKFVERGTNFASLSMSESKRIRTLNRILLISIVILFFYSILMYTLDMYLSAITCATAIIIYVLNYFLIVKGRVLTAKIVYSSSLIILILTFSILFGKGLASEYWIIISGGFYLLIFRERSMALAMALLSVFCFFIIEWAQLYIGRYYLIDEEIAQTIVLWNVFFIFITTFVISYILRYSTEEFQIKIAESNRLLSFKNKSLTDSIKYAKRIQQAILPMDQLKESRERNFFVVFKPKEIVSGDFYWIYPLPDRILFAIVDGAGHGVSGALTSIIAHTFLNQCVEENQMIQPLDIFNEFTKMISKRKSKWNDFMIDNIELSICSYHWPDLSLSYASNGNAIYLLKHVNNVDTKDEIEIQDDDRYVLKEISVKHNADRVSIENTVPISGMHYFRKDDMLYLTTDGLAKQFGGSKGGKFTKKRVKSLLMSLQTFNVIKQELTMKDVLYNWIGKFAPTDDITVLGFKV